MCGKKISCLLILVLIGAVAFPLQASAQTDGYFTYIVEDGKAIITGYDEVGGGLEVVIPSTIGPDNYPVTEIEEEAFLRKGLTSVVIPDSVILISEIAFATNSLTELIIPDSVTRIESGAFWDNDLSSLTIGNSVDTLAEHAFSYNQLTEVVIPDNVHHISRQAFTRNNLTSVTLGNGLYTIGPGAFSNNNLTTITIPDEVHWIGNEAFRNNELTSVNLGKVEVIGEGVFRQNFLTEISLPDSVESIHRHVFRDNQLTRVEIGAGLETIPRHAFSSNQLTDLIIPETVKVIEEFAFHNNNLEWIMIPPGVETIGSTAFAENQDNPEDLTIYGREGSEAQAFAQSQGYTFFSYYEVTFKDYDGEILKEELVRHGGDATAPGDPSRDGYSFVGWDVEFTDITGDLEVKALYEPLTFTVTFVGWDGTVLKTEVVAQGGDASAPDTPVREGYRFAGWDVEFVNISADITVTAQYDAFTQDGELPKTGSYIFMLIPLGLLMIAGCIVLLHRKFRSAH